MSFWGISKEEDSTKESFTLYVKLKRSPYFKEVANLTLIQAKHLDTIFREIKEKARKEVLSEISEVLGISK